MNPQKDEIARQQQRLSELASYSDRQVWPLSAEFRAQHQTQWQPIAAGQPWRRGGSDRSGDWLV